MNIKLVFLPLNTTSKCQPLDQGVIHLFKCYYWQKLVKHRIAHYTLAQTADQLSITVLDAMKWIDWSWKNVTETTIKNDFRVVGFTHSSSTSSLSLVDMDIIVEADRELNNSDNLLQQLDTLLAHLHVGGLESAAAELVDIDSSVPIFNEWDDYEHPKIDIQVTEHNNEEEETVVGRTTTKFIWSTRNDKKTSSFCFYRIILGMIWNRN